MSPTIFLSCQQIFCSNRPNKFEQPQRDDLCAVGGLSRPQCRSRRSTHGRRTMVRFSARLRERLRARPGRCACTQRRSLQPARGRCARSRWVALAGAHHASAHRAHPDPRLCAASLTLKVSLSSAAGVTRNTRVECTDAMIKITCPPYFLQVPCALPRSGRNAARSPTPVRVRSPWSRRAHG